MVQDFVQPQYGCSTSNHGTFGLFTGEQTTEKRSTGTTRDARMWKSSTLLLGSLPHFQVEGGCYLSAGAVEDEV